jgi:hypothetical protein
VIVDDGQRQPMAITCEHEWAYYKEHGTLLGRPRCNDDPPQTPSVGQTPRTRAGRKAKRAHR